MPLFLQLNAVQAAIFSVQGVNPAIFPIKRIQRHRFPDQRR